MNRSLSRTLGKLFWLLLLVGLLWKAAPLATRANPLKLAHGVATSVEIRQIEAALEGYKTLNGHYPPDFNAFLERNFTSRLKEVTIDSWGNTYEFRTLGGGYEIRSWGPDRQPETTDDFLLQRLGGAA